MFTQIDGSSHWLNFKFNLDIFRNTVHLIIERPKRQKLTVFHSLTNIIKISVNQSTRAFIVCFIDDFISSSWPNNEATCMSECFFLCTLAVTRWTISRCAV